LCLDLELACEPALEAPTRPATRARPHQDHVSSFLRSDPAEESRRVADSPAAPSTFGDAELEREPLDYPNGALAAALHRHTLHTVTVTVTVAVAVPDRSNAFGDVREHQAQAEPLAELDRCSEGFAPWASVSHAADHRSSHLVLLVAFFGRLAPERHRRHTAAT
jgi:hypothetical protein